MLQYKIGTAFDIMFRRLLGLLNHRVPTERYIGCPIDPEALPLDLAKEKWM